MKKHPVFIPLLALLFVIVTYFLAGFYFETSDDFAMDYAMRGELGVAISNFHVFLTGISQVLAALYQYTSLPLYSITLYLMMFISLIIVMHLLRDALPSLSAKTYAGICFLVFYFFFLENFMFFSFTRVSILLAGTSLLWLFLLLRNKQASPLKIMLVAYLIIAGGLVRVVGLYLCIILIFPLIFLFYSSFKEGVQDYDWKRFLITITSCLVVLLLADVAFNNEDVKQGQRLLSEGVDFLVVNKEEIDNPRDMLYSEALHGWFWVDPNLFSNINLEKFVNRYSNPFLFPTPWKAILSVTNLFTSLARNYFSYLFLLAGFAALMWRSVSSGARNIFYLWNACAFLLLAVIAISLEVEDRIVGPYLLVTCLINFFVFKDYFTVPGAWLKKSFYAVLVLCFLLQSVKIYSRSVTGREHSIQNETVLREIKENIAGTPHVLATLVGRHVLYLDPFKNYSMQQEQGTFIRLSGWLSPLPENVAAIQSIAQSSSLADLFKRSSEKGYPLLATEEEELLIKRYIKEFYGQNVDFIKKKDIEGSGMGIYRIVMSSETGKQ